MKNNSMVFVCIMTVSVISSSCATMKTNPFIGGAIGATTGALVGVSVNPPESSVPSTFIGVGVGAALGAFIGLLVGRSEQNKSTLSKGGELSANVQSDQDVPSLTAPQVRRTWVKDHVENDQFVKGHYIYSIERSSQWINP